MSLSSVGLLDTSVFIAREDGRPLGRLPDDEVRARRAETLALALARAAVLDV